jgi:hypothetical protein
MNTRRTRREKNVRAAVLLGAGLFASLPSCDAEPSPEELARAVALGVPGPILPVYAPHLVLEGRWIARWIPGRDSTELEVEELVAGTLYRLHLERHPEQGFDFRYDTLADWRDGALWPRGTDAHTHGAALYPARVGGRECLVPSESLARVASAELWRAEEEHAFQRVPEPRVPTVPANLDRDWTRIPFGGYLPGPGDENKPAPWREAYKDEWR